MTAKALQHLRLVHHSHPCSWRNSGRQRSLSNKSSLLPRMLASMVTQAAYLAAGAVLAQAPNRSEVSTARRWRRRCNQRPVLCCRVGTTKEELNRRAMIREAMKPQATSQPVTKPMIACRHSRGDSTSSSSRCGTSRTRSSSNSPLPRLIPGSPSNCRTPRNQLEAVLALEGAATRRT